jgi:hypothetical protein
VQLGPLVFRDQSEAAVRLVQLVILALLVILVQLVTLVQLELGMRMITKVHMHPGLMFQVILSSIKDLATSQQLAALL